MNPEEMSVAQLNDYIRDESNRIDAAKEELRKVCRVRDAKAEAAELDAMLAKLGPKQRAQLIERAGGIDSAEKVGTPGRR